MENCSICLYPVIGNSAQATTKFRCGHVFHLDCMVPWVIGLTRIQCPNCRMVEQSQWQEQLLQQEERRTQQAHQLMQQQGRRLDFVQQLLDSMNTAVSNQQVEQLENPQEHHHLIMPNGLYWCPYGGLQLHSRPPPPAIPQSFRRSSSLDHISHSEGSTSRTRQRPQLNYEAVNLAHPVPRASGATSLQVQQPFRINSPSPALNLNRRSIDARPIPQQEPARPFLQRQSNGSCNFYP